ncbi:hypothetical protein U9M48_026362 [Paspalum notatum var. saurae]|uniref:Rx N-terminal domain-containing protein n=1 Tax=Paspalum notatum var. saurae TaxID=547442 RepID=A0AAQ3TXA3_PASNO
MKATVLSVGKSVLDGALGFAKCTLAEEVALQLGVERDHAFIRDELEMMKSFLMLAHDERGSSNVVTETWVKQARDVAYDVEDNLNDFAIRVGKKRSWWRSPRTLQERWRIAKKMKDLRAKVEDVSQRNTRYQLIKVDSVSKPTAYAWQPSNTGRAVMSGIQEAWMQQQQAKARFVRLVDDKAKDLRVIAVWKTCSDDLGKESIVRWAYDYLARKAKIKCSAWIDLARMLSFEPIELLQTIVKEFYISSFQEISERTVECQDLRTLAMSEKNDLPDAFKEYVKDKCYLIVLKGLSTIEHWEKVKEYFPDNKEGSRIVVYTLEVQVASLCIGPKDVAPEHIQLSADKTLYAIYCKGSEDGIDFMEPSTSLNEISGCSNSSAIGRGLIRTRYTDNVICFQGI